MRSFVVLLWLALGGVLFSGVPSLLKRAPITKFILYVGSADAIKSKGISAFRFDAAEGTTQPLGIVAEMVSPSDLAVHPQNRLLYVVSDAKEGTLSGFAINPQSGALRLLNKLPSLGAGPCHVMVEPNGWMIIVTNCESGSIASFRVGGDGSILDSLAQITNSDPKLKTHPGELAISPDHSFLFGPDRGLDKIFFYRFDPARVIFWPNTPTSLAMKPGAGPERLVFRPDGRYGYALDENTSRISILRYDKLTGTVSALDDVSTLPDRFSGKNQARDMQIDLGGKYLYASNQGDDSVVVFSIHSKNGSLTKLQRLSSQGKATGNLKIDPTGQYLFVSNQNSGVAILQIDRKTGMLSASGKLLNVPSPSCLVFVPAE